MIHNLSYTVTGADSLEKVKGDFVQQAEVIEKLKTQLATLNIAYANETGVKAQQNLSGAILKVTDAIEKQTAAMQKTIAGSKPLQEEIIRELGLIEKLSDRLKDLKRDREQTTNKPQLEEINREIAAKKEELRLLLNGTGPARDTPFIRDAGALEAQLLRKKQIENAIKDAPTGEGIIKYGKGGPQEYIASLNLELDKTKAKISELKNAGNEPIINPIRNVGAIEALENRLKILQNTRKTVAADNLPAIDTQIAKTKAQLSELNGVQAKTSEGAGRLTSTLERMGLRFLLNLFVFQAATQSFDFLYKKITENIGGTDNYIEHQKELISTMEKFNDVLTKQVDKFTDLSKSIDLYFDAGENAYKEQVDAIKAKGVIEDKVFNSQKDNLEAEQALRGQQIQGLQLVQDKYAKIRDIFLQYDKGGDLGAVRKGIGQLGLSPQEVKDFNLQVDEYLKARLKLSSKDRGNFKLSENDDLFKKQADIQGKITATGNEIKNAQTAFDSNIDRQVFEKKKQLQAEQRQDDETYRQLKEKEDINSVDKIVRDTQAKYAAMLKAIDLDAAKTLNAVGAEAFKKLAPFFNALRKTIRGERTQDTANQTFEFNRSQFFTEEANTAAQSAANAVQSRFASDFGVHDFDKLAKAQDEQRKSELDAASNAFIQLREKYIQSGQSTVDIEKQYAGQVEQIEQASYARRLQLAGEYYDKLSAAIEATAKLALTNASTGILNGRRGLFGRSNKQQLAEGASKVNTANLEIPLAEDTLRKDNEAAINAATSDETQVATDAGIKDAQKLADARNKLAVGNKEIHDAKVEQIKQEITAFDSLVSSTQKGYEVISQARQRDLDREISVRTQRIDMAYKLAERGNTQALAQEQKALDTAQAQKRAAAIQEQEVNAALTVSRLIAGIAAAVAEDNAGALVIIPLILAAAATGFAEASAITAAEQKKFFKGGFTGEGGKYESAGEVHKGEFVFDKETTTRHREFFEAIHRGYDPFPVMTLPKYSSSNTMAVNVKGIEDRLDVIAGKSVKVEQNVDKRGVHQIVVEQSKAHRRMYSK